MLSLSHNYFQVSAGGKHEAEATRGGGSGRRYALGLIVLLLVDVLWVTSAEISKWIYTEKKYEKPFFTAYVRAALLSVYLLALCLTSPARTLPPNADYTQLLEPVTETEDENFYSEAPENLASILAELFKGDSTFVPVRAAGETTDSDDSAPRAVRFNKVAEVRVMSAAQAGEALLARLSWQASRRAFEQAQRRAAAHAARSHLKLAFVSCIPWFMGNYLYRVSLACAPASSASLYTSSYGAFALTFCALFAHAPADNFTLQKAGAVSLTTLGLVVIGAWEAHSGQRLMSMLSAVGAGVCYATHLMVLRHEFRRGNTTSSPMFFGLVGGLCMTLLWPLGGALHATGYESFEWPTAAQWSWLLLDGFLGLVLSEPLWLWGKSLTSSATATTMLVLIAPLALCVEGWRGNGGGAMAWAGAALAGAGWAAAAALAGPEPVSALSAPALWLRNHCWPSPDRLSSLRYIPDLDEQTESLIASEEST